jgi:hypothetical protein
MRKHSSCLALFDDQGNFIYTPHGWGPAAAKASSRLFSWGSQMELLDEPVTGTALSLALSTDSAGPVLDMEAHSVIYSSPERTRSLGGPALRSWTLRVVMCRVQLASSLYCPLDHIRSC